MEDFFDQTQYISRLEMDEFDNYKDQIHPKVLKYLLYESIGNWSIDDVALYSDLGYHPDKLISLLKNQESYTTYEIYGSDHPQS